MTTQKILPGISVFFTLFLWKWSDHSNEAKNNISDSTKIPPHKIYCNWKIQFSFVSKFIFRHFLLFYLKKHVEKLVFLISKVNLGAKQSKYYNDWWEWSWSDAQLCSTWITVWPQNQRDVLQRANSCNKLKFGCRFKLEDLGSLAWLHQSHITWLQTIAQQSKRL